ncbi:hypothetical protein FQN57_002900 [Myotisia sp. PD_48]|nr:hypothetical protein FQN57_002900 [Myotisia sp. PD_48]
MQTKIIQYYNQTILAFQQLSTDILFNFCKGQISSHEAISEIEDVLKSFDDSKVPDQYELISLCEKVFKSDLSTLHMDHESNQKVETERRYTERIGISTILNDLSGQYPGHNFVATYCPIDGPFLEYINAVLVLADNPKEEEDVPSEIREELVKTSKRAIGWTFGIVQNGGSPYFRCTYDTLSTFSI